MILRYKPLCALLLLAVSLPAQNNLDQLLVSVQANNKSILAEQRRIEASKAFLQTGLSLPDPSLTLDWMKGFPNSAGNQTDLTAAQAFDFPTTYKYRREVADLKTTQTAYESELLRKNILLEAKLTALHLVYLNKRRVELARRQASAQQFFDNYQKKLEQQDATILDVNKARLLLVNLQVAQQLLESEIDANLQNLAGLNGGNPVVFTDTVYPPVPELSDFQILALTVEQNDPAMKYLQMQRQIGEAEAKLTKAQLLPKFEAGYRYQGLLEQNFHGVHAGVSVPLWENKKRLNYSSVQLLEYDARIEEQRTLRYNEIKRLFEQYRASQNNYENYRENLRAVSSGVLLDKALQAGQITVLEYFLETTLYYESVDRLMELEAQWQKVGAKLMKFKL